MPSKVDAIRARLEAATPGPWFKVRNYDIDADNEATPLDLWDVHGDDSRLIVDETGLEEDADLIANAPTDLAHLLAVADAGKEVERELNQPIRDIGLLTVLREKHRTLLAEKE